MSYQGLLRTAEACYDYALASVESSASTKASFQEIDSCRWQELVRLWEGVL
jgi:hypothetical protein